MGSSMSHEVKKEHLLVEDIDMCMKQIGEILTSTKEAKRVIRDRYYDGNECGWSINASLCKDDMEIIQRMEMIESRTKQLETMIKCSFDVSERKETETTCISPWFFMVGAALILCRKKM